MALEESGVLQRYFDKISGNYQLMNTLLSLGIDRYWRKRLRAVAKKIAPESVLDIACGTADVLCELKKSTIGNLYFGLDLSLNMLLEGKKNAPFACLMQGNGIQTPFLDQSMDLITISFGFRNMPDYKLFFEEAFRLLKPKGNLLILELTQPVNPILRFGNKIYLKTVLPFVSSLFAKDKQAYKYLVRSILAFPKQTEIVQMASQNGFTCEFHLLNGGITTLFHCTKRQ